MVAEEHTSDPQEIDATLDGVEVPPDDRALAEKAFPGWRVLFSESFMWVSRESYPLEWIMREVVQNWVDENKEHPGTLNGVTLKMAPMADAAPGTVTFTMTGAWPFKEHGPLMDLSSGKVDTRGSAGGNGIGVKQAALLAMRDHGVQEFRILGEGWEVQYRLVPAAEVNAALEAQGNPGRVKYGSFMTRAVRSPNRGECHCVITTSNPRVQGVLSTVNELAVCEENPHTAGMQFQNNHGGIRWLPLNSSTGEAEDEESPPTVGRGRLYINGQVYRYREDEDRREAAGFWGGPLGVTLQLNKVDYERTLDRPPMSKWDLRRHVMTWMGTLSKDDLILNLQASEHLWTGISAAHHSKVFAIMVVEAIVDHLHYYHEFRPADYERIFGEKKYLCLDQDLPANQRALLQKRGYTLCPKFFGKIHMPKASAQLSDTDRAATNLPDIYKIENGLLRLSIEAGLPICFQALDMEGAAELAAYLRQRMGKILVRVSPRPEAPHTLRLFFESNIPKEALVQQRPPEDCDTPGRVFYTVAGLVHAGLTQQLFENAHFVQGEYVTTFLPQGEGLVIRNTPSSSDAVYLEVVVDPQHVDAFQEALGVSPAEATDEALQKTPRNIVQRVRAALEERGLMRSREPVSSIDREARRARVERLLRFIPTPGPATAAVAGLLLAAAGGGVLMVNGSETPDPTLIEILEQHDDVRAATTWEQDWVGLKKETLGFVRAVLAEPVEEAHKAMDRENRQFDVMEPNPIQVQQIALLKEYVFLTTGYEINKPFFIYQGNHMGINTGGKAIGLNVAHLDGEFEQAVSTVLHEIAHDGRLTLFDTEEHGTGFLHTQDALNITVQNTLGDIARLPENERTENQRRLLEIEQEWDQLRSSD